MTTKTLHRRALTAVIAVGLLGGASVVTPHAQAYSPTPDVLFEMSQSDKQAQQNKYNSIVYPKAGVTTSGRILAAHERSIGEPVGQTLPLYKSDDSGNTWDSFGVIEAPAYKVTNGETLRTYSESEKAELGKYTSAWTNPYFYVLPENVGELQQGDILLAMLVSGDDIYYQDQKAATPNWQANTDGDRKDLAIALYVSKKTSDGDDWQFVDIIDEGGWQANYGNTFSSENSLLQQDPVWEPFLLVHEGNLIAYYTDEKDYTGFNPQTGELELREDWRTYQDPGTGRDTGNQILAHRVWNGSPDSPWGPRVLDEGGTWHRGELGGGRPGMTNVVETTDGKWIYTAEFGVAKVSDSPLRFWDAAQPAGLPVANWGSPVIIQVPHPTDPDQWSLLLNHGSSGDVWLNSSGKSDGQWVRLNTALGSGFSRNLTYIPETGKVLMLRAGWDDNKIEFAHLDVGNSEGAYYRLINADGKVLTQAGSPEGGPGANLAYLKLQDRDQGNSAGHQLWHLQPKLDGTVTFLAKSSGRALAVWGDRSDLTTWVDDNNGDKLWSISEPDQNGFVTVTGTNGKCIQASGTGQAQQANCTGANNQNWKLELDVPDLADQYFAKGVATLDGETLSLDALRSGPGTTEYNANKSARVLAYQDGRFVGEVGTAHLDESGQAQLQLPGSLPSGELQIAVVFDDSPLVWDTVDVASSSEVQIEAVSTNRCVVKKVATIVSVTNPNDHPVDVAIQTPFGTKDVTGLPAGATQSYSISTRLGSTENTQGQVTATHPDTGDSVTFALEISGTTCN